MVAFNQQFTVLAAFCSLAAISLLPLSTNAVAIQQRAPVHDSLPGRRGPSATSSSSTSHKSQGQRKGRAIQWSSINHVLRMADIAIGSVKRHHDNDLVDVGVSGVGEVIIGERDGHHGHAKRRSSVVIPNNRGGSYIVSPRRRSLHAGQGKRGEDSDGVPGKVVITSPVDGSSQGKPLGYLCMQESTHGKYVMNACEKNSTTVNLVNTPPNSSLPSGRGSEVLVYLQIPFFDPSQPHIVPFCATVDRKAALAEPQPLTVEECNKAKSQLFTYDGKTGIIRPIGQEDGKNDPSTPNNASTAGVTNIIGRRDEAGKPVPAQNVSLVFVPDAPKVANVEEDIVTATSTMTTTITVTSMSTATSSASVVDVDPTSSNIPSSPAVPSSTSKGSVVTSTPVASAAAFNVQVVGLNNTSSGSIASTTLVSNSSASTTSMAAQDFSSSSVSPSTTLTSDPVMSTTSINAAEIAASIAASGASSAALTSTATPEVTSSTAVPPATAAGTESSSAPSITPVNIAPYQMVFKADNRL